MFKTENRHILSILTVALFATVGSVSSFAHAQTIADVAATQRAKLMAEAAPAPSAAQPPSSAPIAPKVKLPPPTPWRLYGVYTVGQKIGADVINGNQLVRVQAGSSLGTYRVVEVTLSSMKIETDAGCGRKCPRTKVVPLGGAF